MKKKLIIIGGGFAGSTIAKELENNFETILIDDKDYFEYTPGILRTLVQPSKIKTLQILHNHYLKNSKIIRGRVSEISGKSVKVNENIIEFDYLVISTGSRYERPMKDEDIILSTRADSLKKISQKLQDSNKILIIGGGQVGVEIAAELASLKNKEITLIHSRTKLIPQESNKASDYAEKFLKSKNVNLIFNERVVKSMKNIHYTKNVAINADITFLAIGIKPNSQFMEKNFSNLLDEKKFIKTNKYLQLHNHNNIFIAGDITNINETKLAQNAEEHAKIVSQNILNLDEGKDLLEYNSKPRIVITSLGKYSGILTYKKFTITGIIPGILKNLIEFWVMRNYK